MSGCEIKLQISHVSRCQHDSAALFLGKIPPIQRRRLSSIAKLALAAAIQVTEHQAVDYIVWVSQFGDEHKTLKILEDVLQGQTPSPTQFSTSVHNAISGLYSIFCEDSTPSTSLAASWKEAVIESYAWLKTSDNKNAKVLVVYYDEPLPKIYNIDQQPEAFAMSAIFSLTEENLVLTISDHQAEKCALTAAQTFFEFWQDNHATQQGVWAKC